MVHQIFCKSQYQSIISTSTQSLTFPFSPKRHTLILVYVVLVVCIFPQRLRHFKTLRIFFGKKDNIPVQNS